MPRCESALSKCLPLLHKSLITLCFTGGSTTATTVFAERTKVQTEFVEIGYIYSVHGLQGEVRVKPSTDFPELRFSEVLKNYV